MISICWTEEHLHVFTFRVTLSIVRINEFNSQRHYLLIELLSIEAAEHTTYYHCQVSLHDHNNYVWNKMQHFYLRRFIHMQNCITQIEPHTTPSVQQRSTSTYPWWHTAVYLCSHVGTLYVKLDHSSWHHPEQEQHLCNLGIWTVVVSTYAMQ